MRGFNIHDSVLGNPQWSGRPLETPGSVQTNSNRTRAIQVRRVSRVVRREPSIIVGSRVRTTPTKSTPYRSPRIHSLEPCDRRRHPTRQGPRLCPRPKDTPTSIWCVWRTPKETPVTKELLPLRHRRLLSLCDRWRFGVPHSHPTRCRENKGDGWRTSCPTARTKVE